MSQSDYILTINTNSELANDRLYRYFLSSKISIDEFNEAKSIVVRVHSSYLKKGNVYV